MLCDLHTHTHFSFDAFPEATAHAMAKAAIDAGVGVLALTDHCEVNGQVQGLYPHFDQAASFAEVTAARDAFADKLTLLRGIELGQPMEHPEQALAMREAYDYDFVILSLHNIPDVPDFYLLRTDRMSETHYHQLYDRLLDEMIRSVSFPGVHTLAHVTYPARYWAEAGKQFDITPHVPRLTKLFEQLCRHGVALEVNVSTLWKGHGFAMPDREVLALYKKVGGELVTIGSDAHAPKNVGNCISEGGKLLLECGFDRIVAYQNGKQFFVPIAE